MPESAEHFVIIGAGQAGYSIAAGLRKRSAEIAITLIGSEEHLPYQRPPLSKKFLLGELSRDRLLLRSQDWFDEHRITVMPDTEAVSIQRQNRCVVCADGRQISYDRLALATGARPRFLPEALTQGGKNIFCLRTIADIAAIQPLMVAGKRLLVIGGGYIGLEAAAVARKIGLEVTLLESGARILGRVAASETAEYFRTLHQNHGVRILEQTLLESFDIRQGKITKAQCQDKEVDCDLVLVGIGVLSNSEIATQAGLATGQGIQVNAYGQSSDPLIYAAGDCACFEYHGTEIRLESVQNASDQGDCVAANMLGERQKYTPKPWFWSDQYDVKLQIAGLCQGYDDTIVRAGKRAGGRSVWYFQGENLLAVDAMNDALAYGTAKKILDGDHTVPKDAVRDASCNLKEYF